MSAINDENIEWSTVECPECGNHTREEDAIDGAYCSEACADKADDNRCGVCFRPGREIVSREPFNVCKACDGTYQHHNELEDYYSDDF